MGSYEDFHFLNIYVDKTLKTVKPIDWGPAHGKYWGVRKIRGRDDLVEYEKFLSKNIPKRFKCESVASILRSLSAGNISCCKSEIFLTQNRLFTQIESEKCDMLEERSTR